MPSPAWSAVTVQVPSEIRVTVAPETVQTPVLLLPNVTVSPDDAVATRVTVLADSGVSGVGVNVIVWLVPSMTNGLRASRPARPAALAALLARPSVAGRPEGAALAAVVVLGDAVAVRPLALGDAVAARPLALGDAAAARPLALGRGDGFRLPCVPVPSAALPPRR
nr:hypothetical protein GCM10020063_028620 [Dactylosporangium thailandense]